MLFGHVTPLSLRDLSSPAHWALGVLITGPAGNSHKGPLLSSVKWIVQRGLSCSHSLRWPFGEEEDGGRGSGLREGFWIGAGEWKEMNRSSGWRINKHDAFGDTRAPTFRSEMLFESRGVRRRNGANWWQVRSWTWFYRSPNIFIMKLSKFGSATLKAYLSMYYIISFMCEVHILLKNVPSGYIQSLTSSHDPYCYQAGP